jgi:hypothetical protein
MPSQFADILVILQEFASWNSDLPLPDGMWEKQVRLGDYAPRVLRGGFSKVKYCELSVTITSFSLTPVH